MNFFDRKFPKVLGRVGVALQARLSSTRLPEKILLPLGSTTVLEECMVRLSLVPADIHLVLTDDQSFEKVRPYGKPYNFSVLSGDTENVLSRYTEAARLYDLDTIIRCTADNPLVFVQPVYELGEAFVETMADYAALLQLPYGAGVEMVKSAALFRAENETQEDYDREHVCPYLYNNPDKFIVTYKNVSPCFSGPDYRITLDTSDDYALLSKLFTENKFVPGNDVLTMEILKNEQ